jgi:Flp pilus assembly protein TadB
MLTTVAVLYCPVLVALYYFIVEFMLIEFALYTRKKARTRKIICMIDN